MVSAHFVFVLVVELDCNKTEAEGPM
jgi:hypothetical protein